MIAEAMTRAHAQRCHPGIDPASVEIVALDSLDAVEKTERSWRHRYGIWARRLNATPPDPWWLVGWLTIDVFPMPRRWAVWLNGEDGRVHVRFQRNGQGADDPYP
jgi:hypothetical protein